DEPVDLIAVDRCLTDAIAVRAGRVVHRLGARGKHRARAARAPGNLSRAGRAPRDRAGAIAFAQLAPLVAIEHRAHVLQEIVGDVDQLALARLLEHVAPIVALAPELGVLERHVDAP